MSDKICLTERIVNQSPDERPEIEPVKACYQAGAKAAIVFSNKALSGLQNPFLLDDDDEYHLVSVTVDRQLGLELAEKVGENVTLKVTTGEDYQYYNGTSMAAPRVRALQAWYGAITPMHCSASAQQSAYDHSDRS